MKKDVFHKYIGVNVPVTACNLRCHYCYVGHLNDQDKGTLPKFEYTPEQVAGALNQKRMGGVCLVSFTGAGETLLPKEIPSYIKSLLNEGHFVMVVTNMVLDKRIDEILTLPHEHLERLFFKCSFHYLELKERKLLDVFCDNVAKARAAGASVSIEITPCDELIPFIDEVRQFSLNKFGALPHLTIARDERERDNVNLPRLTGLSYPEYMKIWGEFDSELFRFKNSIWNVKIRDFCYAGKWTHYLNLVTGDVRKCYLTEINQNIFRDISEPLVESPVCTECTEPHCYNGHAFLVFGVCPSIQAPTHTEVRDRECIDGSHWLSPRMRAFFDQKLYDNNPEYNDQEKAKLIKMRRGSLKSKIRRKLKSAYHRIKKWFSH